MNDALWLINGAFILIAFVGGFVLGFAFGFKKMVIKVFEHFGVYDAPKEELLRR